MDVPDLRYSSAAGGEARATPYAEVLVTLSKQEHIALVWAANYWKIEHRRAAERALSIEAGYAERLRQAAQREAQLGAELAVAQAKIRDLQQRLFGRKSERRKGGGEQRAQALVSRAARGHQCGMPGHGRTLLSHLPERIEWVAMDTPQCPRCGLALSLFPGTEDSEVLEIEVQAYRRVIRRRRYRPRCGCGVTGN
jgi:transposase